MKLTSMKEATLKRQGYAIVKDIILPISTKGITESRKAMRTIKEDQHMPMKVEIANEEEMKALKGFGYNVGKMKVSVHRIDQASKEYREYEDEMDKISLFLQVAVQVDLLHPVGEDATLWEHLGLKGKDDTLGLATWLSTRGMDDNDRNSLMKKIDVIKQSTSKTYDEWEEMVEENGE